MWKNYSADYIKNNRASSITILAAAFIAALSLSFLCSLFYNFWLDNIEGVKLEDGDWHGRLTGELSEKDLDTIDHFANVEKVIVNADLSEGGKTVADIYFYDKRKIHTDMTAIQNTLGLTEDAADYNFQLLSLYFIRIPGDEMPRLIMPAYLAVVAVVCFSLILVIHNSFAVSMDSRIHQFGIFSSIGATPAQIRTCLVQEAIILSLPPILLGLLLGIILSFGTIRAMNTMAADLAGGRMMDFSCHPAILALILLLSFLTVLLSAWIPARRSSWLTPLEAIRGTNGLALKKKNDPLILSALFGVEGELAGNALKAQKKALRTTSLSLTLAFLGFMLMQCFFTLSGISTDHTYFEAYQDMWDIMITVRDTRIEDFGPIQKIQKMQDVQSSAVYQKAEAVSTIPPGEQSPELLALGGLEALTGSSLTKVPIIILDDESFAGYCRQIGITPRSDGAILLNRIWDSLNSNFRYPKYIPYIKEDGRQISLQDVKQDKDPVDIPVLAYTQEVPILREEYDKHALVDFIPLSLWEKISTQISTDKADTYIRLLAPEDAGLDQLQALEGHAAQLIGKDYDIESENRIQEKITNDEMIRGYRTVLGGFCILLAIIGIAHVFSNTLGFLRQRKREFARYMSVGLTPAGVRKMFCIEAFAIVGRPLFIALLLTVVITAGMIKMSYLDPLEFVRVAPVFPVFLFILAVFGAVALAYYLGGKKVLKIRLAEALRDDTMM